MARRALIVGNWKMNGLGTALDAFGAVGSGLSAGGPEAVLCPPATLIAAAVARAAGTPLAIGAQDCHAARSGAHTGDISAGMLADAGARWVIIGHSERRADHAETDALVARKAAAALAAGLTPIICVGETEAERDAGHALAVVAQQVAGSLPEGAGATPLVLAYEPVWAIGTGRVPAGADIAEMHAAIRGTLAARLDAAAARDARLLYGGSVKPGNAAAILSVTDVDGALVGGASLDPGDFLAIVGAAG